MRDNLLHSPLASPHDIAVWDAKSAGSYGVPTFLLMENAAREALHVLKRYRQLGPGLSVAVIAGGGNNGGDGISLARHLHNLGCRVLLLTLPSPGSYRGICRKHLRMAVLSGVRVQRLRMKNGLPCLPDVMPDAMPDAMPDTLSDLQTNVLPDVLIDAVLGAGFKAPLRPGVAALIRQINALRKQGVFVLALDIPSGLGAISGRPEPEAVRASATAAFAAAKPGLVLPWAAEYTGKLHVCEIGIPSALMREQPGGCRLINPQPGVLAPHPPLSHKTQKGRVLVIGGSPGLTGAPTLSALGAARSGAGLVSVAAPQDLCGEIKNGYPEIMTLPLGASAGPDASESSAFGTPCRKTALQQASTPNNTGVAGKTGQTINPEQPRRPDIHWRPEHLPELLRFIAGMDKRSAIVIGPGLGREPYVAELLEAVISLPERPPLVLDADGLFPFRVSVGPDAATGAVNSEYPQPDLRGNTPNEPDAMNKQGTVNGQNATNSVDAKNGPGAAGTTLHLPLSLLRETDVLTPHPGEMLRLLGVYDDAPVMPEQAEQAKSPQAGAPAATTESATEATAATKRAAVAEATATDAKRLGNLMELEQRLEAIRQLSDKCKATLLLKGPATVVWRDGEPFSIAPFAEPNLGVGGSGDVLSGIIAALLTRNIDPLDAACLGAHIHGRSGTLTRHKYPAGGNLASDIAGCIPDAMQELYKQS